MNQYRCGTNIKSIYTVNHTLFQLTSKLLFRMLLWFFFFPDGFHKRKDTSDTTFPAMPDIASITFFFLFLYDFTDRLNHKTHIWSKSLRLSKTTPRKEPEHFCNCAMVQKCSISKRNFWKNLYPWIKITGWREAWWRKARCQNRTGFITPKKMKVIIKEVDLYAEGLSVGSASFCTRSKGKA